MQHTLHRHQAIFEIVGAQILEAHASDCRVEVDGVDEGVDFDRRLSWRKCVHGALALRSNSALRARVVANVDAMFALELLRKVCDETGTGCRSLHRPSGCRLRRLSPRRCAATEIEKEDGGLRLRFLVEAVRNRGSGGLVLGGTANEPPLIRECDVQRRGVLAEVVRNDVDGVVLQHADAARR